MMMLNQLIITLGLLCSYFMLLIMFNLGGMHEVLNIFICSAFISSVLLFAVQDRVFYWSSLGFLALLSFILILQQYHLQTWLVLGLLFGNVIYWLLNQVMLYKQSNSGSKFRVSKVARFPSKMIAQKYSNRLKIYH
jgi:hypothetical protein